MGGRKPKTDSPICPASDQGLVVDGITLARKHVRDQIAGLELGRGQTCFYNSSLLRTNSGQETSIGPFQQW